MKDNTFIFILDISYIRWDSEEPSQDVPCLHPALISESIFHRANNVLSGQRRNMKCHIGKVHHYYLCCNDRRCIIFAEKLILEKGKVAAPVFTEHIQLIFRISDVLRRSEKKKEVDLNHSLVATLTKNPNFRI